MRSREHTLIATLFSESWRAGRDLDLAALITQIQTPPIAKVGVVDLESFFPSKDRFALAMQLNQLLAAPGFGAWLEGEPLDVDRLLYTESGRPRVSVISIAHLDDQERMFFVSLLLNEIVGWMRSQRGTSSLRALDLFRRDLRLPAAGRQSAVEGAAADDPEAGPRVRPWAGRRDAESGRSRLQGAGQRRHVDARPAANRSRQGTGARRTRRGGLGGVARSLDASTTCCRRSASVSSCSTTSTKSNRSSSKPGGRLSYLRGPLGRDEIKRRSSVPKVPTVPSGAKGVGTRPWHSRHFRHSRHRTRAGSRSSDSATVRPGRDGVCADAARRRAGVVFGCEARARRHDAMSAS